MTLDWDKLRIFHAAAEAGSFTHAGETLSISQSAVSRHISALERDLNVPLFHRHARGLVLTEQGELLYRTAQDVLSKLATTQILLADSRGKPSGELRVTTTQAFGTGWLAPRLNEFLKLYPDIQLNLLLGDETLNLTMREADVAIWFGAPTQQDLVRRQIVHRALSHLRLERLCEAPGQAEIRWRSRQASHPDLWRAGTEPVQGDELA